MLCLQQKRARNQRYSQLQSSDNPLVSPDIVLVTVPAQSNHTGCAAELILLQKNSVMRLHENWGKTPLTHIHTHTHTHTALSALQTQITLIMSHIPDWNRTTAAHRLCGNFITVEIFVWLILVGREIGVGHMNTLLRSDFTEACWGYWI